MLKALKIFFREYLGSNIVNTFRFPLIQFNLNVFRLKRNLDGSTML